MQALQQQMQQLALQQQGLGQGGEEGQQQEEEGSEVSEMLEVEEFEEGGEEEEEEEEEEQVRVGGCISRACSRLRPPWGWAPARGSTHSAGRAAHRPRRALPAGRTRWRTGAGATRLGPARRGRLHGAPRAAAAAGAGAGQPAAAGAGRGARQPRRGAQRPRRRLEPRQRSVW